MKAAVNSRCIAWPHELCLPHVVSGSPKLVLDIVTRPADAPHVARLQPPQIITEVLSCRRRRVMASVESQPSLHIIHEPKV
jgi:hypothetical protein